jgi:5'-deoxynucleotidase YfbR-like HD superfamily hydrolase
MIKDFFGRLFVWYDRTMSNSKDVQEAHDFLLKLGEMTVKFADIHRITIYPNGNYENDAEHSFHLSLSAVEIAANYHPELDLGLVSQFSIVHDLPEIYAGDTPSFNITSEAKLNKEEAERVAVIRLLKELPPHTAMLLKRYEEQVEPEARFVRLIDKLLPAVIHAVATNANREDFINRFKLTTVEILDEGVKARQEQLRHMFPEFKFILIVQELISQTSRNQLFPVQKF